MSSPTDYYEVEGNTVQMRANTLVTRKGLRSSALHAKEQSTNQFKISEDLRAVNIFAASRVRQSGGILYLLAQGISTGREVKVCTEVSCAGQR